jgi:hypothetical protein
MTIYVLYVLGAMIAALMLSARAERRMLSFIFIVWIFTQPILNTVLMIEVPGLGFDLQPNRILFVLLLPFLFLARGGRAARIERPPFEKYIYIYFAIVFISLVFNFDNIRKQNMVNVPVEILTFLLVYTVAKRFATKAFCESIIRAIILFAVISALISFIQIGVNSEFLKTGDPRIAFGSLVRASGIFQSEYELGYLQVLAVIITLIKFEGSFWRLPLILLFVTSLMITFHRLDILILLFCLVSYIWLFGKSKLKIPIVGAMTIAALILVSSYVLIEPLIGGSDFVKERLRQDTVSGRLLQYETILFGAPDFAFFGMGDETSEAYYDLMEEIGAVRTLGWGTANQRIEAYAVHNGYLEVLAFYGAFAFMAFILLLFSMFLYLRKESSTNFRYSIVAFYALLIWMLANISNGLSSFRVYFVLLVALLIGSVVSNSRPRVVMKTSKPHDDKAPTC